MGGGVDDVNLESNEAPRKGPAGMGERAGKVGESSAATASA